jgi:hypothetical protein
VVGRSFGDDSTDLFQSDDLIGEAAFNFSDDVSTMVSAAEEILYPIANRLLNRSDTATWLMSEAVANRRSPR